MPGVKSPPNLADVARIDHIDRLLTDNSYHGTPMPAERRLLLRLDRRHDRSDVRCMLISQALNDRINEQIGCEFAASIQYTAIAAHFDAESLPFLARHFHSQAREEHAHAMKFIKFLIDAGARVEIPAIAKPVARFPFGEDAVKLSLEQEVHVTDLINQLMDAALKENNHIAATFLQWFVSEQLEEVSAMDQLLKIVQRAGEGRLLLVEQYLAGYKQALASEIEDAKV